MSVRLGMSSDLLGYTTRLSGKAEYIVTDVLHFIVKAWKKLLRCIRLEEGVVRDTVTT